MRNIQCFQRNFLIPYRAGVQDRNCTCRCRIPTATIAHSKDAWRTRSNLLSATEHITDIKRRIRGTKEIIRSMRRSLPFKKIPKLMMIHAIISIWNLLNYFSTKAWVSTAISPKKYSECRKIGLWKASLIVVREVLSGEWK